MSIWLLVCSKRTRTSTRIIYFLSPASNGLLSHRGQVDCLTLIYRTSAPQFDCLITGQLYDRLCKGGSMFETNEGISDASVAHLYFKTAREGGKLVGRPRDLIT